MSACRTYAQVRAIIAQASKIALQVALDYNKAVDWYFGLAAARDLGTLGIVLGVLFGMWTVATIFSDSGLCLIGQPACLLKTPTPLASSHNPFCLPEIYC